MMGVISNILAILTTTPFRATTMSGSGNSEVKRAWVEVVPGWVTPWEVHLRHIPYWPWTGVMLGVISNILAFLTTTCFGATNRTLRLNVLGWE